jgi:HD-GYP domain-containing protein (c-di-GMP phosphodiesterase class II)
MSNNPGAQGWPEGIEAALDVLDRFGGELQGADQAAQQIRLTLLSVQEAVGADAVFWHPGSTGDAPDGVGVSALSAVWRQEFMNHVLTSEEGRGAIGLHSPLDPCPSSLVLSFLDPAAKRAIPWPFSAVLVRISKSRGNWLAALSFHPRRQFGPVDLKLMLLARRQLLNHRQQTQVYEKLKDSLFGLVRCLTAAIDAKDPYTWGHSERVARMAVRLGKQLSLPQAMQSDLYLAGLLHDIGKIGVRDDVLRKPGRLTPEEEAHVQEHPVIGDRLVCHVKALQHLRPGVRNHHERWDGHGYPDRLVGDDIPLQARILAVADSCDAMMHTRPYRAALPTDRTEQILCAGAGSQWDPHVVAAFQVCRQELYSICQRGLGDSVFAAVEHALKARTIEDQSSRLNSTPDRG